MSAKITMIEIATWFIIVAAFATGASIIVDGAKNQPVSQEEPVCRNEFGHRIDCPSKEKESE